MTTTSPGPTTPGPLLLVTTAVDSTYGHTTDAHWSTLQSNMTDTDGIDAVYEATDAPFGFGYAVLIDSKKEQCLKQDSFDVPAGTKPCMSDPGSCPEGLSFSIWEKHTFSADIFNRYDNVVEEDIKYVLSTGGDDEGHPGIALYHYGIYQVAIVSTGDKYWKVSVPGQMFNGTWCNIGIRWNPDIETDTNGVPISGGLHMLINLKVVGHSYLPIEDTTAKPGLSPAELMLGCHKTQSDTDYRHFGDGEYDELASWNRALPENETLYFLGGYEGNFSNVTPEQFAEMLERVNLKDPDQFAAALTILGKMTQNDEKPTNAPDTTATSTMLLDTSPTPSGPNQLGALSEAKSLQRREALLDIMNSILDPDLLGEPDGQFTKAQGVPYLDTIGLASNLFDMSSQHEWHSIQENGSAGAADLMWKLEEFVQAAFCRIKYDNDTAPLVVVKSTKNIIFVGQKMLVEDLRGKGAHVELPDFKRPELRNKKIEWDGIYDSIRVPTGVLNDDRCDKRPICIITTVYDTYDNVGPSPVNLANIPGNTVQKMDSRLVSFKMSADKGRNPLYSGEIDKSAPLCWPDPVVLTKDPFYFRLEHNIPTVSVNRGLKFHSEEVVTQVLDRRCAWWNANLSDYGVFDSSGCEIVETSAFSTSCVCNRFGIVVVLSEQVTPAEVPAEEYWLTLVKYVLYGISAVLLILYSVVVLYSPVLKEQFHLLGMHLSLAVLLGSVFMCVSDMSSIRESRHMCTTISTLIHFFYVAAGGLVACLGHASFKAITSGVVGGKLNAYACIAWGLALVSVGVPYAFFITDLGTDPRCFISWENYGKATLFVPQTVYVALAFFFGFVVLCNLSTPALRKENLIDDFGSFCRGASFVMIYFAITWSLAVPAYMRFDQTTDFFPMFQIMNSMTGIIIFLFIGLASNRYRGVLVGKAKAKQQKILSLAGGKGAGGKEKLKDEPPPPKPVAPVDKVPSRPATVASLRPPSSGQVAGRPGSRPVTPQ